MALKINRKINKNWIVLGVSLLIGVIAAIFAQSFLSEQLRKIQEQKERGSKVSLVVPQNDLLKGTVLSQANVAVRAFPKDWAPSGAITPEQFVRATGAVLAHSVNTGEAILWAHLETKRAPNFSARLLPGRRAVTVPVNSISSISGMVQPGDLIDLVVTVNKEKDFITYTLLQSVTVLATGQYVEPGENRKDRRTYSTVTIDVTPEDAKRVVAARNIARITAFLRAPGDEESVSLTQKTDMDLLGLVDKKPKVVKQPDPGIQVIYGDNMSEKIRTLNTPRTISRDVAQLNIPQQVIAQRAPEAVAQAVTQAPPLAEPEPAPSAPSPEIDLEMNEVEINSEASQIASDPLEIPESVAPISDDLIPETPTSDPLPVPSDSTLRMVD